LEKEINRDIGLKLDILNLSPALKIGITVEYFNLDGKRPKFTLFIFFSKDLHYYVMYILVEMSLVYSSTYLVTHEARETPVTSFDHGAMRPSLFQELHSIAQFLTDVSPWTAWPSRMGLGTDILSQNISNKLPFYAA
jgi:hypothetical protein